MFRHIAAFAASMTIGISAALAADMSNTSGALLLMNVGSYEQNLRAEEAAWYDTNFIRVEGETLDELKASADACASVDETIEQAFLPHMPQIQDVLPTMQLVNLNQQWNKQELILDAKYAYLVDALGIDPACIKHTNAHLPDGEEPQLVLRTDGGDLVMLNDPREFRSILSWRVLRARGTAAQYLMIGDDALSGRAIVNNDPLGS